jgi:hypothetical protein
MSVNTTGKAKTFGTVALCFAIAASVSVPVLRPSHFVAGLLVGFALVAIGAAACSLVKVRAEETTGVS